KPSFFEITVAMAFDYFAQNNIDIAIIETGLGGRLDSTNIITPVLSVITNIGFDHMNILGDTLEKIAYEKAGIIKQNIPVVIGETSAETKHIFEKVAAENNAAIVFADKERYVSDWNYSHHQLNITVAKTNSDTHENYTLDLTGIYQTKNIITVLETIHQLQKLGWKIDNDAIEKGLSHAKKITGLYGRWELIHQKPFVIIDVAHNVDGIKQVAEQLELMSFSHLHIITGIVKDKEAEKILALLPKYADYYFTKAQIPRALHEDELAAKANLFELKGKKYPDVNIALQDALQHAEEDDLILVCGSVYLAGEVNLNLSSS
ncbi:MAG: Mur ligase family protein, partial [Parafilimonas sp.]